MVFHLQINRRGFMVIVLLMTMSFLTFSFLGTLSKNTSNVDNFRKFYFDFSVTTAELEDQLVVYNRVSKCGSSTMIWILKELAKKNHFHVISEYYPGNVMNFSESEKIEFSKQVSSLGSNTLFIRHFHFFNFAEYNQPSPIFINVVREPVDRFISRFYYRRYGFQGQQNSNFLAQKQKRLQSERINMTIEECVYGGVEECIVDENYKSLMTFFCEDSSSKCRELNDYSLRRAMNNVARYYTSVGLLEDLDNTLKVFQAVLPKYFTGADKLLPLCPETSRTKSRNRSEPSEELKSILRKALRVDVEFYEFVKKRFYRQLDELKKLGRIVEDG